MKRKEEVMELVKIVDKIKKYIKDHKNELLKRKADDEKKIQYIREQEKIRKGDTTFLTRR